MRVPCVCQSIHMPSEQSWMLLLAMTVSNAAWNLMPATSPSEEFTLQRNVMDMVMLDTAECAAHMSDDGILSALVDVVVAYDMTADQPLFPSRCDGP